MSKKTMTCPFCGYEHCRPMGGKVYEKHPELTAEDWADLYWFIRSVQLPFIHRLIHRAQERVRNGTAPEHITDAVREAGGLRSGVFGSLIEKID